MYAFMHSTCQNGTAISVRGSAQAPIVLPILATALCDLPQSRVPPLCCVSFWPATTRRIYTNTRARAESRMHNRLSTYSIARTQIQENTAIPRAAHVFTKKHLGQPHAPVRHEDIRRHSLSYLICFFACAIVSLDAGVLRRVDRVDEGKRFWLRASMLQQVGVACGRGCKCSCKWKVWKLPPPVLWLALSVMKRSCYWYCSGSSLTESEAVVLFELRQPMRMLQSLPLVGGCTASWFCICLLSMLQLALLRLRFLSIASQFHTVMDMLLTKSKTRRPIIVCWGVNFNDSYYDPRIRVFVVCLPFF